MMQMPDVMILCGGRGERLRSVVHDRPKPLADFQGRPFLEHLLVELMRYGFRRFLFLAGYKGDQIQSFAEQMALNSSADVITVIEPTPLGTAGALAHAGRLVKTPLTVVMNGDSFCSIDYRNMIQYHYAKMAEMTIAASMAPEAHEYGTVVVDNQERVVGFIEKKQATGKTLINAGVYVLNSPLLLQIPVERAVSLEQEMIPQWIGEDKAIYSYQGNASHYDIGTPERFAHAQQYFKERKYPHDNK